MSNQAQYVTAAAATIGAIGGAYCAYQIYTNYKEKSRIPTEWTRVGTLSDLYVFPIKSCGPVVVDKAECSILGLKDGWLRDRILMVVDEKMNFLSARIFPQLFLVHPTVTNSILTLKHVDLESIHIDLAEVIALQKPKKATVWGISVPVYDCGAEASKWFSRLFDKSGVNYRLVYYASKQSRSLHSKVNAYYRFTKNDTGTLQDEAPFNLINEASVEDLNTRLKTIQVTHRVYRPNFVLKGAKAYDEDNWRFIKIGDNIFEIIRPCTRCILTAIDPETGIRNAKSEALETLRSYRQVTNPVERNTTGSSSPRLGLQIALRSPPGGIISLNDAIYVA